MTVTIRKLDNKDHEYFAYTKSLCGKATYFVYFHDDIWGAIVLHNFIEMLRSFFQPSQVTVSLEDKNLTLINKTLLQLFKDESL